MISASSLAPEVDHIFYILILFCGCLALSVFVTITYFLIKFRASKNPDRKNPRKHQGILEKTWIVGTLILFIPLFIWGAETFFSMYVPPHDAVEVNVVAKQWMWKFYRPNGVSEINDLHIPLNKPVRLIMISEDVIHSFFIPDFRVKQDVLPGRYTSLWFTPTQVGRFRLLCTQYCGTNHAGMNGYVIVMNPPEFEQWQKSMQGSIQDHGPGAISLVDTGRGLYHKLQCSSCHDSPSGQAPNLQGLFGKSVSLTDGTQIIADENYIEESIVKPSAKVVKGFRDIMPSYRGQLSETELMALTNYIKSLSREELP